MKERRNGNRTAGRGGRPLLLFLALSLAGCGGGAAALFSGGGIGGTGLTTGVILAFGSVKLDGTEFFTDNATVKLVNEVDDSRLPDNAAFRLGMVVSVRHGADDNNAAEIDHDHNVKGPVTAVGGDNTFTVLGYTVAVDGATVFDPAGTGGSTPADIAVGKVVEASGLIDSAGRLRATYVEIDNGGSSFRVRGYVGGLSSADGTFGLGPLPDIQVVRVRPPSLGGLANGQFVDVRTSTSPADNTIVAERVDARRDRFDVLEPAALPYRASFDGLVTRAPQAPVPGDRFELEGKVVQTTAQTEFFNGTAAGIRPDTRLKAEGIRSGGVLEAERITFR